MNSKGFTLIELVVVIVILGILAATAAPKFINLKADAQTATLQGVRATMQGAASLIHSKSLVKGNQKEVDSTINLGDGAGFSNDGEFYITYGYPFANESEWKRIIDLDDNFIYLEIGSSSTRSLVIYRKDSPAPTNFNSPCILYYRAAENENSRPEFILNKCI